MCYLFSDTLDGKFYKSYGRKYFFSTLKVSIDKNWLCGLYDAFLLTAFHSSIGALQNQPAAA